MAWTGWRSVAPLAVTPTTPELKATIAGQGIQPISAKDADLVSQSRVIPVTTAVAPPAVISAKPAEATPATEVKAPVTPATEVKAPVTPATEVKAPGAAAHRAAGAYPGALAPTRLTDAEKEKFLGKPDISSRLGGPSVTTVPGLKDQPRPTPSSGESGPRRKDPVSNRSVDFSVGGKGEGGKDNTGHKGKSQNRTSYENHQSADKPSSGGQRGSGGGGGGTSPDHCHFCDP